MTQQNETSSDSLGVAGFEPRELTLKDGRVVRVRLGTPDDAPAFRDYLLRSIPTTEFTSMLPDEVDDEETIRRGLGTCVREVGGLKLLAEPVDQPGVIVADCGFHAARRRKLAGVLTLGMMCDEPWRGVGLGRALLGLAIDWAQASPGVRRLELGVFAANAGALAMYESFGFVEEGRFVGRLRQGDGSLVDELVMARSVDRACG